MVQSYASVCVHACACVGLYFLYRGWKRICLLKERLRSDLMYMKPHGCASTGRVLPMDGWSQSQLATEKKQIKSILVKINRQVKKKHEREPTKQDKEVNFFLWYQLWPTKIVYIALNTYLPKHARFIGPSMKYTMQSRIDWETPWTKMVSQYLSWLLIQGLLPAFQYGVQILDVYCTYLQINRNQK